MAYPRLTESLIPRLARALGEPLPGEAAQRAMLVTPAPARNLFGEGIRREGAVLALLYPYHGELHLALTRRSVHLRYHGGQVSLPGGGQAPKDATLWHTALREACEETGLEGDAVGRLGALTSVEAPASGYVVQPYVAHAAQRPAFRPDPREVAALVELPLGVLLDPEAKAVEEWQLSDRLARVPFYRHGEVVVWGATAMILSELEAVIRGLVT